jgi:hypothetical protein
MFGALEYGMKYWASDIEFLKQGKVAVYVIAHNGRNPSTEQTRLGGMNRNALGAAFQSIYLRAF